MGSDLTQGVLQECWKPVLNWKTWMSSCSPNTVTFRMSVWPCWYSVGILSQYLSKLFFSLPIGLFPPEIFARHYGCRFNWLGSIAWHTRWWCKPENHLTFSRLTVVWCRLPLQGTRLELQTILHQFPQLRCPVVCLVWRLSPCHAPTRRFWLWTVVCVQKSPHVEIPKPSSYRPW